MSSFVACMKLRYVNFLLALFLLFDYIFFKRSGLRSLGTLVPVLGVTWILGMFAVDHKTDIFQYIFVIANSLQVSLEFDLYTINCSNTPTQTYPQLHKNMSAKIWNSLPESFRNFTSFNHL